MGSPPTSPFTDLATRSRANTFWSRPQPAASEVLLGNSRTSRVAAPQDSPVRPKRPALAQPPYGYQAMINYRDSTDLPAVIREACPEGNDIFFDNTGGAIADAAIRTMRLHGRIIQCGTAANASWTPVPTGPRAEREILTRRLRWSGFIIFDHIAEFEAAATRFALDGKIVHDEEILPGLEHAGAIAQLYRGDTHGKLIIAVD